MKLLTKKIKEQLLANGRNPDQDHAPVVKLFNPVGGGTWLLNELEDNEDIAFGLCDLGFGFAELGNVSISELQSVTIMGLGIERDLHFKADKPMSEYAAQARKEGRIVA